MSWITLAAVLCLGIVSLPTRPDEKKGSLEITFLNVRNGNGQIAIGINASPAGWPHHPDLEHQWKKRGVKSGTFTVVLEDLPYGTYAISVLDDENSNGEMDSFLGIPREGFGFSGNPETKMRVPRFDECDFRLDRQIQKISIHLRYIGKGK